MKSRFNPGAVSAKHVDCFNLTIRKVNHCQVLNAYYDVAIFWEGFLGQEAAIDPQIGRNTSCREKAMEAYYAGENGVSVTVVTRAGHAKASERGDGHDMKAWRQKGRKFCLHWSALAA
jgi:hypothetical protein